MHYGICAYDNIVNSILQVCVHMKVLERGQGVYDLTTKAGFEPYISFQNKLAYMYITCGNFNDAHQVFDKMPKQDIVSFNGIITRYTQNGYVDEAQDHIAT